MIVKISVAELEQALQLLKATSADMQVSVRLASTESIALTYSNIEGQLVSIEIYDEATRCYAKVHSTEQLRILAKK